MTPIKSQPTLPMDSLSKDDLDALALIEFMAQLGDDDEAQRMAEKIEPHALASQFIFAIMADGSEAFVAPAASFERDDNGAFEYWDVLSPVKHLFPPGSIDTSGTGFWYFNDAFTDAAGLGEYLLDKGFKWSLPAQLYVNEEIYDDEDGHALGTMRTMVQARELADLIRIELNSKPAPRV